MEKIKQGDFSVLASQYHHRVGYGDEIVGKLLSHVGSLEDGRYQVADVGAGTGKLTRMLAMRGLNVTAVEPNDAMRAEGVKHNADTNIRWIRGSAEKTNLLANNYDWITMASSFHWVKPELALPEFHRILRETGFVTVIWNPRDLERSQIHMKIEDIVKSFIPDIKRVSSGGGSIDWGEVLVSTGHFHDPIYMEVQHDEVMPKERYMGIWRSVNDIRAQAGEEKFAKILDAIENEIKDMDTIAVPYKMRAWTAKKIPY